jgi:hypothetical protein
MARNLIYFDINAYSDIERLVCAIVEPISDECSLHIPTGEWEVADTLEQDCTAALAYGPGCITPASIGKLRKFDTSIREQQLDEQMSGVLTMTEVTLFRPSFLFVSHYDPNSLTASMVRQAATLLGVQWVLDLSIEAAHDKLRSILTGS